MDDDGQQVAASIVTRDSAYALIATSWINSSNYILDGMITLYKLLMDIVEMDINLSRLLINQESENVSLSSFKLIRDQVTSSTS